MSAEGADSGCIYCGEEVEDAADMFCPECMEFENSDVVNDDGSPLDEAETCGDCGAVVDAGENFCSDCGWD